MNKALNAARKPKPVAASSETQKTVLQSKVELWDWYIESDAKKGAKFTQVSHPGDELFPQLKAHFEKKGFSVSEFSRDEGHCIGDVWRVQIDWT
jgi:hypothetical protein